MKQSFAKELLEYEKKRDFRIMVMFFLMWILTFTALIYISYKYYELNNDIGVIETTTQEVQKENESGDNNFIGNDGDINYE